MSAIYLTDISAEFSAHLLKEERTPASPYVKFCGEWKLLELVEVRSTESGQGGVERWRVYDSEASPEFEGKLVEPQFRQDYDEDTRVVTSYVSGRTVVDAVAA